ncbi:MAG: prephenate dehydrogenase [Bacteroidales bacterium]|nr:prephenate dehydrogenase [Bacteroidales bacterium]
MKVGIIGLGLIGGSMAIDLRRKGFADELVGVEAEPVNAAAAEKIGLVDRVVSYGECIEVSDLVIVAVPVGAAVKMLPDILDRFAVIGAAETDGDSHAKSGKIVIDVCSTKESIVNAVHYHPMRRCYVATHPMAGTEYSGPWAAMPGLFDGRACIICNSGDSSPKAVKTVEAMYDALNMRQIYMNASNHDVHTAYVSHISHITSFALALTVLEKERNEKHIFDLASGGFSSTVRLAKSNAEMWVPILSQNRDNVLQVVDTYIDKMKAFREAIAEYDEDSIRSLIEEANRIKRIIR